MSMDIGIDISPLNSLVNTSSINHFQITEQSTLKKLAYHNKKTTPPTIKLSETPTHHSIEKRKQSTITYNTRQLVCAERLGVEPSECNQYGVFIARTKPVMDELKHQLNNSNPESWTPRDLSLITTLELRSKKIDVLGNHDFNGLTGLTEINLHDNQLSKFPSEITNLTQLKNLYLDENELTEIPIEIGKLQNLSRLFLSKNKITKIEPEMWNLKKLTVLSLEGNNITEISPKIGNLKNLRNLYLYQNKLTELPASIKNLTNLFVLSAYGNKLQKIPKEVAKLTNLSYLYLHDNDLSQIPSELGQLTNLIYLQLNDNKLQKLPASLEQLDYLTHFSIENNEIKQFPPEIGNIKNLTEFKIYGNPLELSTDFFKNIMSLQNPPRVYFKNLTDKETPEPTIRINGVLISLAEVITPFMKLHKKSNIQFVDLSNIDLQNPYSKNLTPEQKTFLCTCLSPKFNYSHSNDLEKKCTELQAQETTTSPKPFSTTEPSIETQKDDTHSDSTTPTPIWASSLGLIIAAYLANYDK